VFAKMGDGCGSGDNLLEKAPMVPQIAPFVSFYNRKPFGYPAFLKGPTLLEGAFIPILRLKSFGSISPEKIHTQPL